MSRAKQIVVGCRSDALAALHCERACAALREAHPHAEFVAARGNGGGSTRAAPRPPFCSGS